MITGILIALMFGFCVGVVCRHFGLPWNVRAAIGGICGLMIGMFCMALGWP